MLSDSLGVKVTLKNYASLGCRVLAELSIVTGIKGVLESCGIWKYLWAVSKSVDDSRQFIQLCV